MPWLINAAQLDKFRKNQKNILIFDVTYHVFDRNRDAHAEFAEKHIAGSHFLDITQFCSSAESNPHDHMLLSDDTVSTKLGALGIRNDTKIIFYDNSEHHTSCRAVWMMKMYGHNPQQLYVLDGGISAWEEFGGKCETGNTTPTARTYQVNMQSDPLKDLTQIKTNLHRPTEQIIDLRHAVRFAGGKEPRPLVRPGHIPGAFSFPYQTFFEKNGRWKSLEKIRNQLTGTGVDLKVPIISMCGSGISAPILNFFLDVIDVKQNAMYNGSWAEWGSEKLLPTELSLDERPTANCLKEVD